MSDLALAQEIERRERAKQKYIEEKEFASLRVSFLVDFIIWRTNIYIL